MLTCTKYPRANKIAETQQQKHVHMTNTDVVDGDNDVNDEIFLQLTLISGVWYPGKTIHC